MTCTHSSGLKNYKLINMKKILISLLAATSFIGLSYADTKNHATEISEKSRETVALRTLKAKPNTIQVYAKGLICESCGIGVRKKLQKLKFVDKSQPKRGIIMDVHSQLVSISLKPGKSIDVEAIKKAVKGAGYEPITLYSLNAKKLKSISLEN